MLSKQTQISWVNDNLAFYLSKEVQSHHVFENMLEHIERADELIISSFAINEQWIRRLIRYRDVIKHITLILDFTFASRNPAIANFAAANCDLLLLTANHSKTIFLRRNTDQMLAVMSNNATSNQRYESGVIMRNMPAIDIYCESLPQLKINAVVWTK